MEVSTPSGYATEVARALTTTAFEVDGIAHVVHHKLGGQVVVVDEHGGTDAGARGIRFLEWGWDPDPADTTIVTDSDDAKRGGCPNERNHRWGFCYRCGLGMST